MQVVFKLFHKLCHLSTWMTIIAWFNRSHWVMDKIEGLWGVFFKRFLIVLTLLKICCPICFPLIDYLNMPFCFHFLLQDNNQFFFTEKHNLLVWPWAVPWCHNVFEKGAIFFNIGLKALRISQSNCQPLSITLGILHLL